MKQTVNTRYGKMVMAIGKKYLKEHSNMEFEKEFLNVLETDDYDYFIDVGAAWGYFSIPASHYCETVLAFEPSDIRRNMLINNVDNLNLDNIIISNMAVGTGELDLFYGRDMVGPKTGIRNAPVDAHWIALSELVIPRQKGIIKIDVEGFELDVVKSIGDLNKYKNLVWLIERHQKKDLGYSEKELFEAMKPYIGKKVGSRAWTHHYVFRRG